MAQWQSFSIKVAVTHHLPSGLSCNSQGDGIWEMREFFGPGWRMYYVQRGELVIMMLGGGDKSSQASDIEAAKAIAKELTP